jgi:hypothetical protein
MNKRRRYKAKARRAARKMQRHGVPLRFVRVLDPHGFLSLPPMGY